MGMRHRRRYAVTAFCVLLCIVVVGISAVYAPEHTPVRRGSDSEESMPVRTLAVSAANAGSAASSAVEDRSNRKPPAAFNKLKDKYHLVPIPTYDGSYQLTHPKVLYFPKGWNGYRYWMSMTPYPYEHDAYENPSIVVSNDGNTWAVPKGAKNPVTGLPPDVKKGGHYSDPHLVLRGNTMELWYRYNIALPNKKNRRLPNNAVNIYFRKTTADGVHWTAPQKLLESRDGHLSLCVNYENGIYKTWYATYGGQLCSASSKNATDWDAPTTCTVPLPKGYQPYHQDMLHYGSKYYLLQTAEKTSNYTFALFLLTSDDGIHFTGAKQLFPDGNRALYKNVSFYRSTLFVKDGKLNFYVSMIIPHLKWYMTQMTLPIPKSPAQSAKPTVSL